MMELGTIHVSKSAETDPCYMHDLLNAASVPSAKTSLKQCKWPHMSEIEILQMNYVELIMEILQKLNRSNSRVRVFVTT